MVWSRDLSGTYRLAPTMRVNEVPRRVNNGELWEGPRCCCQAASEGQSSTCCLVAPARSGRYPSCKALCPAIEGDRNF
jgi:hypothetical protein